MNGRVFVPVLFPRSLEANGGITFILFMLTKPFMVLKFEHFIYTYVIPIEIIPFNA